MMGIPLSIGRYFQSELIWLVEESCIGITLTATRVSKVWQIACWLLAGASDEK